MTAGPVAATSRQPRLGGYGELTRRVRELGLLRPRPGSYARHAVLVFGSLALTVAAMWVWHDSWWLLALAPVLAVIATQTGFLGHDVAHLQVTRDARRSRWLGLVVADLMSGLSYGWWIAKHNAHHAHPNDLERDPDVRVGTIVFDADQASGLPAGLGRWVVRHQAWLFFPLLVGEAVNLHVASVRAVITPGVRLRAAEGAMLSGHFVAYAGLLLFTLTWPEALVFVVVHKGLQGIYLGVSFAPNHKGMPTLSGAEAEDPLLRQVLTSRNVRGGPFIDVALGGLNYQIEHHLFPSMPRANLRRAQPVVREFCAEAGIAYVECSAVASYAEALGHLHRVGAGLRQD